MTSLITATSGNYIAETDINVNTNSPTIIAGTYTHNGTEYPIQPYFSVPNNVVCNFESPNATFQFQNVIDAGQIDVYPTYVSDPNLAWNFSFGTDGMLLNFYFWEPDQVMIFRISVANACGTETYDVAFRSEDCAAPYQYTISPNPSTTEIVVESKSRISVNSKTITPDSKMATFSVNLYNEKGVLLKSDVNIDQNPKVIISTQGIPNGKYFIHIMEGRKIFKRQVIIQH